MAIDPIAVAGGATTKIQARTDIASNGNAATNDGIQNRQASVSGQSADKMSLFDFNRQQAGQGVPVEALDSSGKALRFANPSTLGEQVLNYLEGFHKRVVDYESGAVRLDKARDEARHNGLSTGPASMMPTSTASSGSLSSVGTGSSGEVADGMDRFETVLQVMNDAGRRHAETNLVSGVGQQFSRAMGTLMRGQ